jgi:hypothetical protein
MFLPDGVFGMAKEHCLSRLIKNREALRGFCISGLPDGHGRPESHPGAESTSMIGHYQHQIISVNTTVNGTYLKMV